MEELTVYQSKLPANIEEIAQEVLIGRDKLNAIRAAVKAAQKLNHPTWKAMQEEGREYGERILDYELMLKEYFDGIPKASGGDRRSDDFKKCISAPFEKPKQEIIRDLGFTRDEAKRIQQLTPEAVAEAKAEARENDEIVTRSAALRKVKEAQREARRAETVASLDSVKAREEKAVQGVYDVIVIDPPWPMQKIEREVRPNQIEFDYPTMTEAELEQLTIPVADNCHVWLWTTQKYLPMAFRLLDKWGLFYICTFVWHKPGGFQPYNLPQYNCEFALYAHKGAPIFVDTKAFPTCFNAPRGQHSEKPEEFYDVIRRVTSGRRLDMFNRRTIEGFDGWGKEAAL